MEVIFGINPLIEALRRNDEKIRKIVIARGRGGDPVKRILSLAAQRGVPVEFEDKKFLDRKVDQKSHQGVIGYRGGFNYAGLDDIIANRHGDFDNSLVLILDGITDPQNLGSLIRTAHCYGANGVIIPERRSASVTAAVIKSSAGAVFYTPVAKVINVSDTIEYLKGRGFWIYGTDPEHGKNINDFEYNNHVCLIMGSEGKGMRPLIKQKCDFLVSIPMRGVIGSLNVSVAAGIILHEILKEWRTT
ncbi:MAG: 23S rRNA (guanosine(2251)-2'-O)-methyltransferase RlmB [Deltaproteobacteria bacterium]|nr:23S rRNA (guanosine(2251)-2'-O)-methyltransferase RlmB [Deltaproteobacteria bacterium]